MRVDSSFKKCSICLKPIDLTWEHIIPESIGGTLESNIQCRNCNSTLGSELVSKAKNNYCIRLAINYLKKQLPSLYESIEEGQDYTGISSEGSSSTLKVIKGKLVTRTHKKEKRIIYDKSITEKHIVSILRKEGKSKNTIKKALLIFNDAPINIPINIVDNIYAIKNVFREKFL